jgi:hypothetical protein
MTNIRLNEMTDILQQSKLSTLFFQKLNSKPLWQNILLIAIFFHLFTWSFPYPSNPEAEKYLQGLRGEAPEVGWIILTRIVDMIFSFGYAKFAFVLMGLACVLFIYQILARLANDYLAVIGALIFSVNSFIFTFWHRAQPEVVVALLFLACVYLYVRFATYWHIDIEKSAHITTFGIVALSFGMLNTDFYSLCLIPPLVLLIFFVQVRIYSPGRALVSTLIIALTLAAVQWLMVPRSYSEFIGNIEAIANAQIDLSVFEALRTIYTDGYASPVWQNLYKKLEFLKLDEAPHRVREMFVLMIVGATFACLFVVKLARLISGKWARIDFMAIVFSPHIPLVLMLLFAFLMTTASQVAVRGVSPTYLFFQVFILILLCLSIYAFFLKSTRGDLQIASEPRWSEIFYKLVATVACIVTFVLSLTNAIYYVTPFRGSNYPTIYDALQRRWEGTECSSVAYAPPLYVVALASEQHPPARSIEELYITFNEGKPLAEGCIILPLIAKDGVYGYAQAALKMPKPFFDLVNIHYMPIAQIVLPFYQKDPAYPVTALINSNPYEHAHGVPIYGFGGMEAITIYRKKY